MSPPEPPRRKPSKPIIVDEREEPGAHRPYREPSFGERPTPPDRLTTLAAPDRRPRPSNPPPAESLPPPAFRREPAEDGPPLTRPRAATLTGMPAPPSEPPRADGDRDSTEIAVNSASSLADQLGQRARELSAAKVESAEAKAETEDLRRQLDAATKTQVLSEPPDEKQLRKARLHSALLKFLGSATALAAAVATYLSVTAHTELTPRVDNVVAKQDAQRAENSDLPDRVKKIEMYLRAMGPIAECKEAHVRSAIKRGTGYDNTTLSDRSPVHWSSEGSRPNLTWFPVEQCATPSSPMPQIP